MTNSEQAIREFAEKYGIAYRSDNMHADLAALISEHYVSREDVVAVQQQPTAEGAEEILDKHSRYHPVTKLVYTEDVLVAMHEFASLHAQKLADKMVSERLREELIKFLKWDLGSGYGGMTDEEIIDEYLKTRES